MTCQNSVESSQWVSHFLRRSMTALHVSRRVALQLTPKELQTITKSIQQFQLGEGSRGRRLLERGKKFGRLAGDPYFAEALELFIKEEQQHSRYLDAFMESQGIPPVSRHWSDTTFRRLRGLAGLEMSLTVLVTAEIMAVPYYRALRCATGSAILKMICSRILEDEANHLKYQASILARLSIRRAPIVRHALRELHQFFLLGTLVVVWKEHRDVLEAGGYDFRRLHKETMVEFFNWTQARAAFLAAMPAFRKSVSSTKCADAQPRGNME